MKFSRIRPLISFSKCKHLQGKFLANILSVPKFSVFDCVYLSTVVRIAQSEEVLGRSLKFLFFSIQAKYAFKIVSTTSR